MASPGRLRFFRTTAFKLSAIYLAVFTIFAAFIISYIARNTTELLTAQMQEAVDAELTGLAEQYRLGGIARLARVIERRSRQPGASLYLVTDFRGEKIAGNVASVPLDIIEQPDSRPRTVSYNRLEEGARTGQHVALVRVFPVAGGFRLLVGRDVGERNQLEAVIRRALILTVALMVGLGLISWLFVSRHVLKRIDSVAETSGRIIAGDLSGRLEVTGTGDEFDRLAESLNRMLERIERLLIGLKEVSDNIAHDLKTPLTRMRNRVEAALNQAESPAAYRDILQATIDDADQLIRTFNALLMIARVEAGSSDAELCVVEPALVARDVYELYEPLAEEAGIAMELQAAATRPIRANRELVAQAIANLVDNAIKYAAGQGGRIVLGLDQDGDEIRFSVADNGPGIAEADRARATERFVRLEESRSKPGAGLGLSLVTAVARLHGGRFNLEDNAPGLRAVLSLPAEAGP